MKARRISPKKAVRTGPPNYLLQKRADRIWAAASGLYGAKGSQAPKIWVDENLPGQQAESVHAGDDGAANTGVRFSPKLAKGLLDPNSNLSNTAKETLLHEWEHQYQNPRPVTKKDVWEVEGGAEDFAREHAPKVYAELGIEYHNPQFNGYPGYSKKVRNQKGRKWINRGQDQPLATHEGNTHAAYERNQKWAKPSETGYQTELNSRQSQHFNDWLQNHKEEGRLPGGYDPDAKHQEYDLKGYWLHLVRTGQLNKQGTAGEDGAHMPDAYKTPYDASFSKWSKYAKPGTPLVWRKGNRLVNRKTGRVVYEER
ncbi:MAG: hypothetical protein JST59_23730 [Actinobacteria bacterium]|nr:hypothetical protein [Actinomycetota bacterium]